MRASKLFHFLILGLATAACSRHGAGTSSMTVRMPNLSQIRAVQSLPSGRKACFGVNVTASDIPMINSGPCTPPFGVIAGYAEPGQDVTLSVPMGDARTVELYLFLKPAGDNTPCPPMVPPIPVAQIANIYRVAVTSGVAMNTETVNVTMTVSFPGESTNIAQQLNMGASCQANNSGPSKPTPYSLSAGGEQTISGGTYQMKAHVGAVYERPVLSNGSYKIITR